MSSPLRFTLPAAVRLRQAIAEADGVEVFAIGDVTDGVVVELTITCRGQSDRVTALIDRPRAGQVVIHNHPSGNLTASDADMQLAGLYGDDGVGMVIVDSDVTRSNWVVEPHAEHEVPVDEDAVRRFFYESLPRVIPDFEARPGQVDMALAVARSFTDNRPFVVEAGTGTGKSLAYLVPAALWALANNSKVVVSTHTKALQAQLLGSDLPLLPRAGIQIRAAVLQGRSNYICKRRLGLAAEEDRSLPVDERTELDAIVAWEQTTADGARGDLPVAIEPTLWERIESDSDLTLRVRCQHYAVCHFYQARRKAAGAHIVVVNHALLLADLAVREAGGAGVLPKYKRLVLDEAHHLEESATGAVSQRLSVRAISRATSSLLSTKKKRGALIRLLDAFDKPGSPLPADARAELPELARTAAEHVRHLIDNAKGAFAALTVDGLEADQTPLRLTPALQQSERWTDGIAPTVRHLADALDHATGAIDAVTALFADIKIPEAQMEPLLQVTRAHGRLGAHAGVARAFLADESDPPGDVVRWLEAEGRSRDEVSLNLAPVEVGATLKRLLWEPLPGTVSTSATLTVATRFGFWANRVGLGDQISDIGTAVFPSPFDHFAQALLAMPRDLPEPDADGFMAASADIVVDAVRLSDGGAFVLCTSYKAVDAYAAALRRALPPEQPVLVQGKGGRTALLDRFRANRRSVLVGTDSFWEGVSVKGEGLRLVIIPRLPFRVPTEPLRIARHERIANRGGDPFRAFALPEAVIKLRQGYGRLIRHKGDRGVVLLLDRRLHDRSYGAVLLGSLPPARRLSAPWQRVREELVRFFSEGT